MNWTLVSNFLTAFITLIVGGLAIYLYRKQKNDYKRDVALLILQEIRYAEQQVRSSQSYSMGENYPLSCKLLPTNSWYKNIHLFMNDFEQPQIDAISRFYAEVEYVDLVIEKISDYKTSIIEQSILDASGKELKHNEILPERMYLYNMSNLLALNKTEQAKESIHIENPQVTSGIVIPAQPQFKTKMLKINMRLKANTILSEVSSRIEFIYNTPIGDKFRFISKSKKKWFLFF